MDYSLSKKDFWNLNPTFHEKIMWQIKNERDPLWPIYADKLKAKEIAINNNIPVPKLLLKTKDPDSIDFSLLPDMCMFKANHGCGWNCLYYKGRFFFIKKIHRGYYNIQDILDNAKESSKEKFLYFFRNILKIKYTEWSDGLYKHEWYYDPIDPWVYAEELIINEGGTMPEQCWLYSVMHGDLTHFVIEPVNKLEPRQYIPNPFSEECTGILKNFEQIRLDFLLARNKFYFTEFTVADGGGTVPPINADQDTESKNTSILRSSKWTYK